MPLNNTVVLKVGATLEITFTKSGWIFIERYDDNERKVEEITLTPDEWEELRLLVTSRLLNDEK